MTQRKTQTAHYWQKQFTLSPHDVEAIYNQILELGTPLQLDNIALALIKRHCDTEELEARSELQDGKLYQPNESYAVNDSVIFPALEFAVGKVVNLRQGQHPEYGTFSVIEVKFNQAQTTREFAAKFNHNHPLNTGEHNLANLQGLLAPEELYQANKAVIASKIKAALNSNQDFVAFHDQYFLADLLTDFHEGWFNIADAAIDINQGPLSVDSLIEQMRLVEEGEEITDVVRFSVSYSLANDERFDDVGPSGQVRWYLERIEPPEAHHPPLRLQSKFATYDSSLLDDDLYDLLAEIDDELTPAEDFGKIDPDIKDITITLNYPHQRVGTLPLTPKTLPFFPISYYNPVLFDFIDGRTGNSFPGWTVLEHNYAFGLDEWYKKHKLPVGAYINIKRTDNPMQVIVDFEATRTQRDWIRMAAAVKNRLTFQMNPAAYGCKYDELMVIAESNTSQLDALWVNAEGKNIPIYDILCQIFPELSKLNPQSTVHAKTLYSALNVIRRAAPGAVFQELATRDCFIAMNHGYWTFDPNLRD